MNFRPHLCRTLVTAASLLVTPLSATANPCVDLGVYGLLGHNKMSSSPPAAVQAIQTGRGDNNLNRHDLANGSEIDQATGTIFGPWYMVYPGGGVGHCPEDAYLFVGGNLKNGDRLEIFIDSKPGGQQRLRGDNPDVDGLARMGDDGSGNGLTFDDGFAADYWICVTVGGATHRVDAFYAELPTGGGGQGYYLGWKQAGTSGGLQDGDSPYVIQVGLDNLNVAGVAAGCQASSGAGVNTGIDLEMSPHAIGWPAQRNVKFCVFVNSAAHDSVSNQVLGPLPAGTCNLGDPRSVDFRNYPGNQYFDVWSAITPVPRTSWGHLRKMYH
jgi:hypothetical protein